MPMRINRFYTAQTINLNSDQQDAVELTLDSDVSGHIYRVLRMQAGEQLVLFNGDGYDYFGIITESAKRVKVQVSHRELNTTESPFKVHLIQALARGERMDYVLQKAVELGVTSISLLQSTRVQFKFDGKRLNKKMQHWQKVIQSACEQSGRAFVPKLHKPVTLDALINDTPEFRSSPAFVADPQAESSLNQCLTQLSPEHSQTCQIIVGPEGGLTPEELLGLSQQAHVQRVTLGPRILRTEPAALVMLSQIQGQLGDLS